MTVYLDLNSNPSKIKYNLVATWLYANAEFIYRDRRLKRQTEKEITFAFKLRCV